jgi:dynein heavy chain, axonemal
MGIQAIKPFMDKVLQLYDTIQVRHGLMLVGPTGGGKTCNYTVL